MIIIVYDKQTLELVSKPYITSKEEFTKNPSIFFPNWNSEIHISSDIEFKKPILENGIIREKTREEICSEGDLSVLLEGEVFENNSILFKEKPTEMLKPSWEYPDWVETATKEDVLEYYKQQIIQTVREIGVNEAAGFYNEGLNKQLEELKRKHLELSHEIANEINLRY